MPARDEYDPSANYEQAQSTNLTIPTENLMSGQDERRNDASIGNHETRPQCRTTSTVLLATPKRVQLESD